MFHLVQTQGLVWDFPATQLIYNYSSGLGRTRDRHLLLVTSTSISNHCAKKCSCPWLAFDFPLRMKDKPLCRACNVRSKVISFITKLLQSHTEKQRYTSRAALITELVLNFSRVQRMYTSADSASQQINELLARQGLFQSYNKTSCQGWSIYLWWTIQLDSENTDKKATSPAHMLLWVHLYCQPLVTLQHPDHLHPRTEQENSFSPLKKSCNKLFLTLIFHFHTFTSFRVHCDKCTETSTLRGPELTFLLVLCRQADVYTCDASGPFVPSRWVWYCA